MDGSIYAIQINLKKNILPEKVCRQWGVRREFRIDKVGWGLQSAIYKAALRGL